MIQYFRQPYKHSVGKVKVESHLSNYPTRADLKGATGNDTSPLVSKTDFASLETKIDNLDVDKLKTVPANLS